MVEKDNAWIGGAVFAVLGLMVIIFSHDLQAGFILLGLSVFFMASTSPERMREFFVLMFLMFKGLVEGLQDFILNR